MQDKLNIGFDAKRAFFNRSGLGNYSRDTIRILSSLLPENQYFLYCPKKPDESLFRNLSETHVRVPSGFFYSSFPSIWRSSGIINDLKKDGIRLFHGLSNEIPFGIRKSGIKSLVSIPDLIFLTHPGYYKIIDREIYRRKFSYSASYSDAIIAVSQRTKDDIVNLLGINQNKIFVVYQGCNPVFNKESAPDEKEAVRKKYGLPSEYLLCVGTIEERKNQLSIIKAMHEGRIDIPLVLIGRSTAYSEEIKKYLQSENIRNVQLLHNVSSEDLPAIYQMASVFVYPSRVEGFGIPVLEALYSRIPVITSGGGSMEEAGGRGALYVNPENTEEISHAIRSCLNDSGMREGLIRNGIEHSINFTDHTIAKNLMQVYNTIL